MSAATGAWSAGPPSREAEARPVEDVWQGQPTQRDPRGVPPHPLAATQSGWRPPTGENLATAPAPSPGRRRRPLVIVAGALLVLALALGAFAARPRAAAPATSPTSAAAAAVPPTSQATATAPPATAAPTSAPTATPAPTATAVPTATPRPQPTATVSGAGASAPPGGQRYVDTRARYALTVPSTWTQVQAAGADVAYQAPAAAGQVPATVNIVTEQLPSTAVTLEQYDAAGEANLRQRFPDYRPIEVTPIAIDGRRGLRRTYTATIVGRILQLQQYYLVENGVAYVVSCGAPADDFPRYTGAFEQIAASFLVPAR